MLLLIAAVAVVWLLVRVQPLIGDPHLERLERFHSSLAADSEKVVICLGDSLTRGNASFDYVHALALRLEPWGYTVLNAGVNGELAWNLLQRVHHVVSSHPAYVVLLVGTNDARACEDAKAGASLFPWGRYVKDMGLPQPPDEDFFFDSYRSLLDELTAAQSTQVIAVTLPPMGEKAGEPVGEILGRFNDFIEQETRTRGMVCIPLGRKLEQCLVPDSYPDTPEYSARLSSRMILKALVRRYLFGWDWNRIGEQHRMQLLTDLIHLNASAGSILVDLAEAEIKSTTVSEA